MTTENASTRLVGRARRGETVLEMRGITKKFPGVLANDNIDFSVKAGEIHALLGENGAGKTTLMNILYGIHRPDDGEILIRGSRAKINSPSDAILLGIGMVHQHLKLVQAHTVLENMIVGHPKTGTILDMKTARSEIEELCQQYGFSVDLTAKIWQLSAGEKQIIEILKALYRGAQILILDEPTSTLTPEETEDLLDSLRVMVERDLAVIPFVTHKLPIVLQVSDRITVLREGRVVDTVKTSRVERSDLARMMVGREVLFRIQKERVEKGAALLRVEDLSALNDRGVPAVKGVSFSIHEGEVFGIAGVTGNGQTELVETLAGLRQPTYGKILFAGRDVTNSTIRERREMGIEYVPANRVARGSVAEYSLVKNLAMSCHLNDRYYKRGLLNYDRIREEAKRLIHEFDVKAPSVDLEARHLSGGNLQKFILARVFSQRPRVLLLELPTHGLDIGATEFIRNKIMEIRADGTAVLLISEDLDEVLQLSDTIAPIYEGSFAGVHPSDETTREEIGSKIGGGSEF